MRSRPAEPHVSCSPGIDFATVRVMLERVGGVALAGATLALLVAGCAFKTDALLDRFNSGALDSPADPFRTHDEVSRGLVARTVRDAMIGAYFAQGSDASGSERDVARWLRFAREHCSDFFELVREIRDADHARTACDLAANQSPVDPPPEVPPEDALRKVRRAQNA